MSCRKFFRSHQWLLSDRFRTSENFSAKLNYLKKPETNLEVHIDLRLAGNAAALQVVTLTIHISAASITSHINGYTHNLTSSINCKTENVIYGYKCKRCPVYFSINTSKRATKNPIQKGVIASY